MSPPSDWPLQRRQEYFDWARQVVDGLRGVHTLNSRRYSTFQARIAADEYRVDAWMPLWIGDYLASTMKLTTLQHGAYLLLLIAYWRNCGPLDDDDEDLASIIKATPP
jgi:hypothetical protein